MEELQAVSGGEMSSREELEDIITDYMGRGDDEPSPEEIQRFKEAEEELEKLSDYD